VARAAKAVRGKAEVAVEHGAEKPAKAGRAVRSKAAAEVTADASPQAADAAPGPTEAPPVEGRIPPARAPKPKKRPERKGRKKAARFDTGEPEVRKKKRARLERMRRAGVFGVPGRPSRLKRRKARDEMVRPSPPLEQTDPLKHYLSGAMVPCPVGCGGFSEVVRVSTMEGGAGEIWFECLSCAQRRMFELPPATIEERTQIFRDVEQGHEAYCPRHTKQVQMRRRGRDLVCPECGVSFQEP
jgi:hypothetical protein